MWLAEKGCMDTVTTEWSKFTDFELGGQIVKKVENCGKALQQWSRKNYGHVHQELQQKQKLLAQAELEALLSSVNF